MISCEMELVNYATLITALSSLITVLYIWYDRRPRLIVNIEAIDLVYCISIENVGKTVARNIKISISEDLINSLPENRDHGGYTKKILRNVQSRKFYLAPGVKKYYFVIPCKRIEVRDEYDELCNKWHENNKYTLFRIDITYNGWYECSEEFFMDQFDTEALIVKDSLTKIYEILKRKYKSHDNCSNGYCTEIDKIIEDLNILYNEENENEKP